MQLRGSSCPPAVSSRAASAAPAAAAAAAASAAAGRRQAKGLSPYGDAAANKTQKRNNRAEESETETFIKKASC